MQWQPRETFSIRVDRDVPVTMRDGTVLMTDVYRPAAEGRYRCSCNGRPTTRRRADSRWSRPTPSAPSAAATRSLSRIAAGGTAPTATSARSCRRCRWLRRRRVVRQPVLVGRQRRYGHLLRRGHAVAGRHRRAAEPARDRPGLHCFRLLRGLDLSGRRVRVGLHVQLGALSHHGRPAAHQRAPGSAGLR